MSALQIKDVPPYLHEAVRRRAGEEGKTVRDYLVGLIERDLQYPGKREWIERVRSRSPLTDVDAATELDEGRVERERELFGDVL